MEKLGTGEAGERVRGTLIGRDFAETSVVGLEPYMGPVAESVDLMWGNDFDGAEGVVAEGINAAPRFRFAHATSQLLRAFVSGDVDALIGAAAGMNDVASFAHQFAGGKKAGTGKDKEADGRLRDLAKAMGKDQSEEEEGEEHVMVQNALWDTLLVSAEAMLLEAMLLLNTGSKMSGGLALRKSWKKFKAIQAMVAASDVPVAEFVLNGINFGVGLFYFVVSLVPPGVISKVVKLLGFSGDRVLGLALMRSVFDSNMGRAGFAAMILCFSLLSLPRGFVDHSDPDVYGPVHEVLDAIQARYPKGALFFLFRGQLLRKEGDATAAADAVATAIAYTREAGVDAPCTHLYELANSHYHALNWVAAVDAYEDVIVAPAKFGMRGMAALARAAAMVAAPDDAFSPDQISAALARVPEVATAGSKSNYDNAAVLMAAKYGSCPPEFLPLLPIELLFYKHDIAHLSQDQALSVLDMLFAASSPIGLDLTVEGLTAGSPSPPGKTDPLYPFFGTFLLVAGALHRVAGHTEAAIAVFDALIAIPSKALCNEEKGTVAYALSERSELFYHDNEYDSAATCVKSARKLKSSYFFSFILTRRLATAREQLANLGASA